MSRYLLIFLTVLFSFTLCVDLSSALKTNEQRKQEKEAKRKARRDAKDKEDKTTPDEEAKKTNTPAKKKSDKEKVTAKSNNKPRRPEGTLPCIEKEFTLATGIETEPEVKLTCIVPVDGEGKPTEGANDIVFYSPFAGARKALAARSELRRYANALGMTIFTIEITTDTKYLGDEQKYYCYAVSGWHEAAVKAYQKILEEFKLEKRKMLIVGDSVGGSYAQQIAARYPDLVDAAAFTGGRLFGETRPNNISWLIMSTWECPGMQASRDIAKEYASMGMNVLQTETPPVLPGNPAQHLFHHTPSRIAYEIMEDYLAGIRDLRKQNNGKIPPSKDWPAQETILGQTYSFPSAQTAKSWKQLPQGLRSEISKKERLPIVMEPQMVTKDTRVVIYAHDPEVRNTILEDNICYIALQGHYAVALNSGANAEEFRELCNYIRDQFPRRNIYAIGAYESGEHLAAGVLMSGLKVKRITLLNTDAEDLIETLDGYKSRIYNKSKIKILLDEKAGETPKNKYGIEQEMFNQKEEFGPAWFSVLDRGAEDND